MPDVPENVLVNAARANWRADLLRYHSAEMTRIVGDDSSPAAASFVHEAASKSADADLHVTAAQVELELGQAKAAYHANPKDQALYQTYKQAAQDLADMRATWRSIGEAVGSRRAVLTVDHFPEPSDEEVLASHGEVA